MSVPFFRAELNAATKQAVMDVLDSGWFTTGRQCANFEQAMLDRLHRLSGGQSDPKLEAIAVNSCTAALHLALEAVGVGPEHEVIVPVLTFTATAEVIRYLGASPVFVDIDPATLCIDLDAIEASITPATKAIMVVHFGGLAVDMVKLGELARKHGLAVIEDAAHAIPTMARDGNGAFLPIGAHGSDAICYSFYANKTLTTGEGGMVITSNPEIGARIRTMRLHGINRDAFDRFRSGSNNWRYDVVAPGFKYNMTDIAAAMGIGQLEQADELHEARKAIVRKYDAAFAGLPLILPPRNEFDHHSWHLYPIQLADAWQGKRDEFLEHLMSLEVGFSVHYTPLHQLTYWRELVGCKVEDFPRANSYFSNCCTLPLFPSMTDTEIDEVIQAVRTFGVP